MHLMTSNKVTHAAKPDFIEMDSLKVHYCDFSKCRHMNRHKGRLFSKQVSNEVDCMMCISQESRGQ